MKKTTILLVLTFALMLLTACSPRTISIEDHTWRMRTIIQNDSDASVPAVGITDELYPDAPVIDLTLTAEAGKLVITDSTNNAVYEGTYAVADKSSATVNYVVTVNGQDGYAATALTEYSDNSKMPTMTINLGSYSIYLEAI